MYRLFVSEEKALTAGIKVWNYPKVIAQIEFEDTSLQRIMKISKDNKKIIEFRVSKYSHAKTEYKTVFNIYSIKDNQILKSPVDWKGVRYFSRSVHFASFTLGESEYAEQLRLLAIKNYCLEGSFYPDLQYILNPPSAVYPISKES